MLPFAAIALLMLLLFATRALLAPRQLSIAVPRAAFWPALLLAVSWLISARMSRQPHLSVALLPSLIANLAIFFAAANCGGNLRRFCWAWLIVSVLVAVNGLARLGSEPEFLSTFGNRNFLGAYLSASVLIAIGLREWRATSACLPLLAGLWFCGSRGAWLALAAVAGAGVILRLRGAKRIAIAGLFIAVVIVGGVLTGNHIVRQWQTDVRPVIWKGTLRMIAARPVFGHGPGAFVVEYPQYRLTEYFLRPKAGNLTDHAHNEVLEIAAEQGIIGLVATVWLWGAALWLGWKKWPAAFGVVGAAGVFVLHGLVDVNLRFVPNQSLLWLLLGLAASGGDKKPVVFSLGRFCRLVLAAVCVFVASWVAIESVARPVAADYWERRARLSEARGDRAAAATEAGRSLQWQPLRLGARYLLAGALAQTPGAEAQAIQQCLLIEALAPDYADITFNLGQLYLAVGQPAAALPYLRRAVEINPHDAGKRDKLAAALAAAEAR